MVISNYEHYKNAYSVEPRDRRYAKGYGFLYFANIIGKYATKATKNISNKYGQKLVDTAVKSGAIKAATDAIKTA